MGFNIFLETGYAQQDYSVSYSACSEGMSKTDVNILGKGSTGRTVANNLNEQLAMKEVMSNPLESASKVPLRNGMTDSRWLGTDGWTKMQRVITTSDGNITIHFNYNEITGAFDDFKFK